MIMTDVIAVSLKVTLCLWDVCTNTPWFLQVFMCHPTLLALHAILATVCDEAMKIVALDKLSHIFVFPIST